jgi:hypothetical protein
MLQHIAECREDTWIALWVVPILEMLSHASTSLCGPLQALLSTAVSHHPRLLTHILQPIMSDTCTKATHLRTLLSCVLLARKQGALDNQSKFQHCSALWKGVLDVRILEQALYHRDVEVSSCAIYRIFMTTKYLLSTARYLSKYCICMIIRLLIEYIGGWKINLMDFTFAVISLAWRPDSICFLYPWETGLALLGVL